MIYLDSMKNIKNYEEKVSKVWCIVRSLKFPPRLNHALLLRRQKYMSQKHYR